MPNTTFVEVACQREGCGKPYQCPTARYNRAKSYGTKLYCSPECARFGNRTYGEPKFFARRRPTSVKSQS